jgi:hypothetical protein
MEEVSDGVGGVSGRVEVQTEFLQHTPHEAWLQGTKLGNVSGREGRSLRWQEHPFDERAQKDL